MAKIVPRKLHAGEISTIVCILFLYKHGQMVRRSIGVGVVKCQIPRAVIKTDLAE